MSSVNQAADKKDITWYIKWISSIILLIAVVIRSIGIPDFIWVDLICSFIGTVGWLTVGLIWKDRALILLNLVISMVLFAGIVKWFLIN